MANLIAPPIHGKKEPAQLRRGREFERRLKARAGNAVGRPGKSVLLHEEVVVIDGRRRRVDVMIDLTESANEPFVSVVEIKSCDWEGMKPDRVFPNGRRHANQVRMYVDGCVNGRGLSAAAGIIYERAPKDKALMIEVEAFLDAKGIQTMWADQPDFAAWD